MIISDAKKQNIIVIRNKIGPFSNPNNCFGIFLKQSCIT